MSSYSAPHIVNCIKNLEQRYLVIGEHVNKHNNVITKLNTNVIEQISEDVDYLLKSETNAVNKIFNNLDGESNENPSEFTLNLSSSYDRDSYSLHPKVYSEKILSLPLEIVLKVSKSTESYVNGNNLYVEDNVLPSYDSESEDSNLKFSQGSITIHETSHSLLRFSKCAAAINLFDLLRTPNKHELDLEKFGSLNQEHIELSSSDYAIIIGGQIIQQSCKLAQLVLSRTDKGGIALTGAIIFSNEETKVTDLLQDNDGITIILNTTKIVDINMSATIKGMFSKLLIYSALSQQGKNTEYTITSDFMSLVNSTLYTINKYYFDSFVVIDPETGLRNSNMTVGELKFYSEINSLINSLHGFNNIHSLYEKGVEVFVEPISGHWSGTKEIVV